MSTQVATAGEAQGAVREARQEGYAKIKISGVLIRGRWIDRKAIDEKMREVAAIAEQ